MKKLALALVSISALVFGFGMVANAQYVPAGSGTVTPSSPPPGTPFTVRVNCTAGAGNVTFVFNGGSFSFPCTAGSGLAGSVVGFVAQTPTGTSTATLTAPTTPGTYPGTATQGGTQVGAFSVTVPGQAATTVPASTTAPVVTTPGSGLPATGSGGISTTTGIAIGLLVVGLGLFVVAQVRRRQPHPA